ncbi:elongin-A isoform X1 [Monodelphis domestica]|uniref:elongin-A isoform X1 n=1 Tax=Monodelphis domestica TaxID=13616 RepID=UPI0024E22F23|nr:elongin-A isoform X1 [Monodelphis domestica]
MAAESVLEVVERLQSRLAGNPEPKKLLKHLKRLSDLPITVDILAETGVGKTVNGLRKHEQVGGFAKDLVARWKKLVPVAQEVERSVEPEEQDLERSSSRKRPRDVFPKEEEVEGAYRESWKASCSRPHSPECREKKHRKLSEFERTLKARDERKRWDRTSPFYTSDHELSDSSHVHSPQPTTSPQQFSMDYDQPQEEEEEQLVSHRKVGKSHGHVFQDRGVNSQERCLGEPQDRVSASRSKEHKTSQKEKHRLDTKEEKTFTLGREKVTKAASREEGRRSPLGTSTKEKQALSGAARRERDKEGSSSKKKSFPSLEGASVNHMKKAKHKDAQKSKLEKTKLSVDSFDVGKWEGEFSPKSKGKGGSNSLKTREGKSKASDSDRKTSGHFPGAGETDVDDDYEQPTMSFESYLSYDQPQRKKKKVVKTTTGVRTEKSHSKQNGSKADHKNSNSAVQKLPKMNESKAEKQHSGASSAKLKKISPDVTPTLPDIPLPTIQANYRPLPSLELIPSFQPKRKAVSSPHEDEEAGFTGRRMNSKMQVYSGSKCAYLPKMMSLHQQCIRVLNNNIDSIYEVGGVPYSVLEPVLERCTPEQLYRIEECNHVLTEETDQLWKIHCHRDFKRERPEEFESWREMYLRLQDAREQRLLLLTENIRSAHANKPKGRQAKMAFVNSVAKPPRDVRRRQEKFGTGGAAVPEKIKIKPAPYTSNSSYACSSSSSVGSVGGSYNSAEDGQPYDGPSTSSAHSVSSAVSSTVSYDPRKPPVKKIAPMMAKTIKAFKNRFSRR